MTLRTILKMSFFVAMAVSQQGYAIDMPTMLKGFFVGGQIAHTTAHSKLDMKSLRTGQSGGFDVSGQSFMGGLKLGYDHFFL